MRVAIIGMGKMGLLHGAILNSLKGVNVCALADSSKFLTGFAKNLTHLPTYGDYIAMLDKESPDAVVIATPVFLHVDMAMECATRGIPFFLEKPLAIRAGDAKALVQRLNQTHLVTMVGYMMRYAESFAQAKEIIDSNVLGKIIQFRSQIYVSQLFRTGKGWRYEKSESGGGVVIGQATHLIDLLRWYFGDTESVSAHTKSWYSKQVEDFAHAHLSFTNGVSGWLDSSWSIRHHRLMEITIELDTENGNLIVTNDFVKYYLDQEVDNTPAGWHSYLRPDLFKGVEFDVGGTYYTLQDQHFVEAVRSGKQLHSNVQNAYEVQKIVDAIYRSAEKKGQPMAP